MESALLSGVISFAAKGPLYAGGFALKDQAVFFKLTAHDSFPLNTDLFNLPVNRPPADDITSVIARAATCIPH